MSARWVACIHPATVLLSSKAPGSRGSTWSGSTATSTGRPWSSAWPPWAAETSSPCLNEKQGPGAGDWGLKDKCVVSLTAPSHPPPHPTHPPLPPSTPTPTHPPHSQHRTDRERQ